MVSAHRRAPYADRHAAGEALLAELRSRELDRPDAVTLALPRGGVPVAAPIARGLASALDVLLVRKIGHPYRPELAMGAVARVGGTEAVVRNDEIAPRGPADEAFEEALAEQREVLQTRERRYREDSAPVAVQGRPLILVDDGLATGATMRAAVEVARRLDPATVTVVAPIGSPEACAVLAAIADAVVCPWVPRWFAAVGEGYRDFRQVTDDEVVTLLMS